MSARALVSVGMLLVVACGGAPPPRPPLMPPPASATVEIPSPPAAVAAAPASEDDAAVPIAARNPTWGSRSAPVTIVEFADLQCPYSARLQATLKALEAKYGPDTLRLVWKNEPLAFHLEARNAARAAAGVFALAGADAFWRFKDLAYANQSTLGAVAYAQWAREAGVTDVQALEAGLKAGEWGDPVDADLRDAKALGATGTPTLFVNGVLVTGAQPLEKIAAVVDAELPKARAKIAAGVPASRVYAELARENLKAPAPAAPAEPSKPAEDTRTVYKVPLGAVPTRGDPGALVTLIELGDFQCPFTARVQSTLAALIARYPGKLRIAWRNEPLPFHAMAEPAAEAALEVRAERGDAAFWAMHDALFAGQKDLSEDSIVAAAAKVGASGPRVRLAIQRHLHKALIDADLDLADDFQASGTPHFFIDGRRFVGAQSEEKFAAVIDEELARAEALVHAGTRPADLYAALTRDGQPPKPPEAKDLPAGLPGGDPSRGPTTARVTVHEFADFQCPFCQKAEASIALLEKDFPGRVRVVWHDLPLPTHPDAMLAAIAAREAFAQRGSAGFFTMRDTLFANQDRLKRNDLDAYAAAMGLAMDAWNAALDRAAHAAAVEADKTAATEASIHGTPTFLITPNGSKRGWIVTGAQPYARFRKLVARGLAGTTP